MIRFYHTYLWLWSWKHVRMTVIYFSSDIFRHYAAVFYWLFESVSRKMVNLISWHLVMTTQVSCQIIFLLCLRLRLKVAAVYVLVFLLAWFQSWRSIFPSWNYSCILSASIVHLWWQIIFTLVLNDLFSYHVFPQVWVLRSIVVCILVFDIFPSAFIDFQYSILRVHVLHCLLFTHGWILFLTLLIMRLCFSFGYIFFEKLQRSLGIISNHFF